jgi:signal transduction histidine kinase
LGLSLVKAIVDNHNGRIWLTSQEEVGTTFFILLPAAVDREPAGPPSQA